MNKQFYMGRNIGKDDKGYYLTFSDHDLKSTHDKGYERAHFTTYAKALSHMNYSLSQGWAWFDAHFDPSI